MRQRRPAIVVRMIQPDYLRHQPDPIEMINIPPIRDPWGNLAVLNQFVPLMDSNGAGLLSYDLYPFMGDITLTYEQARPPVYNPADNGELLALGEIPQGVVLNDYLFYEGPIDEDLIFGDGSNNAYYEPQS